MFEDKDEKYESGVGGTQNTSGDENGEYRYSYTPQNDQTDQGGKDKKNKPKRKRPFLRALLCGIICGAVILVCIVGGFAIGSNLFPANTNSVTVTTNEEKLDAIAETEETVEIEEEEQVAATTASGGEYTVSQIAEQCGSSVVAITNRSVQEVMTMFGYYEYESEGSGSGVIVGLDDEELLIVTNYHVVEDADELSVCFFDSEDAVYSALIKGTDPNNDLAVVSVSVSDMSTDVLNEISIATIGDSDNVKVGDEVVAIGNALGLGQSVTSGIVSALDREVYIDNYTARLIQTDAAINPGNSGGALFNMKGELIGINSAKYASEEVEGMGFAIPTSIAQPIIETLMSQQTREKLDANYGALSITGSDVSDDASSAYGMPQGVYVVSVMEGGAAENAGIQTGDIITALDGISLTSITSLRDRLQYYAAGETVEITFARNSGNGYEERTVELTLDNGSELDENMGEESGAYNEDSRYNRGNNEGYYGDDYGYGDSGYGDSGYGDSGYGDYGYGDYGYGDSGSGFYFGR